MSKLNFSPTKESDITTPATGVASAFIDTDKNLKVKNDAGFITSLITNFSITSQAITTATRTYIDGSKIAVPSGKLQVGSMFRWSFNITKTAAGTAASTYDIAIGTAGTTADTSKLSFTKPAGTAVVDEGFITITAIVRSIGTGGVISAEFCLIHSLSATGHATVPCFCQNVISSGFDTTVSDLFCGICVTSGVADALTINQITTEAWNL